MIVVIHWNGGIVFDLQENFSFYGTSVRAHSIYFMPKFVEWSISTNYELHYEIASCISAIWMK